MYKRFFSLPKANKSGADVYFWIILIAIETRSNCPSSIKTEWMIYTCEIKYFGTNCPQEIWLMDFPYFPDPEQRISLFNAWMPKIRWTIVADEKGCHEFINQIFGNSMETRILGSFQAMFMFVLVAADHFRPREELPFWYMLKIRECFNLNPICTAWFILHVHKASQRLFTIYKNLVWLWL